MSRNVLQLVSLACISLGAASAARADVVILTSYSAWSTAIGGGDATLDFVGQSGFLSDEYASLGVHFLPGSTVAVSPIGGGDNWGVAPTFGAGYQSTIDFDTLQYSVGIRPVSQFTAALYLQGSLVYQSGPLVNAEFQFRGLISTQAFDRVVFTAVPFDPGGIDNIYIGNPIPAPGVAGVLAMVAVAPGRRRRR
jgi:opacity protein-like surface antigen